MVPRGLIRALSATYSDPADEWKRQALSNAGATASGRQPGARFAVRVKLGFMFAVTVAGAPLGAVGWAATLLTLLSVLLVQELPRALSARVAKRSTCVVLSAHGSNTELGGPPFTPRHALALALLGSLANLGVAALLAQLARRGSGGAAAPWLSAAAVAHGLWGLGQALPLTPFRVGRELSRRWRAPLRFAHAALSVVGISVAGLWVLRPPGFPSYFSILVLATIGAFSALRDAFNEFRDQQSGVAALAAAARARLDDDQPEQAMALARRALSNASVESHRAPLWKTLAWAAIARRDPFTAHGALMNLAAGERDLHLVAAYLAACNRNHEAIELVQEARRHGHRARETSMLLVDLLFQADRRAEAMAVAESDRGLFAEADWNAIASALVPGDAAPQVSAG